MSFEEFNRSANLLQLILQHAEALALADLRQADLRRTQRALGELHAEESHLRADLNGMMPAIHATAPTLQRENHAEQIVHAMLNFVWKHYASPITLKECAGHLKLNSAYLSDLFSQHVGLPFKAYLTDVRLERARELLGDVRNNISEVARAVGYNSENRFRFAFKKATGLTPSAWRETLRVPPSQPA